MTEVTCESPGGGGPWECQGDTADKCLAAALPAPSSLEPCPLGLSAVFPSRDSLVYLRDLG